ncbi:MAG TPA: hypothetical protein VFZ89_06280, partial [Solirubrobacteraceae bacterium]
RSVPGAVTGLTVAVPDPDAVAARWAQLAGGAPPGVAFVEGDGGIVAIALEREGTTRRVTLAQG